MEGKTLTNEKRFYPLLVSNSGGSEQTEAESDAVWSQLDRIPEANKKILLSGSMIENLYQGEQIFGWEPYYSIRLAYFVRELFFQNISQSEFYKAIEALFGPQFPGRFNEILSYINNTILTSQPDPEEEEEEQEEVNIPVTESQKEYTLLDALSKFSNLSYQVITTEKIKLKSSAEPVRPTLTNWLKNYRDELGIGVHDSVARAHFLFESSNTKSLPSSERDRIHSLVRSLEDNELLLIDTKKQEIVFPEARTETYASSGNRAATNVSSPDIFERFQNIPSSTVAAPAFSSVPGPELKNVGTQTFGGGKASSGEKTSDEKAILARIKGMLVSTPKANAPAPKEDFREEEPFVQEEPGLEEVSVPASPLGMLRFSAKHVLPAERQSFRPPETAPAFTPDKDSRLNQFSPREVSIPDERRAFVHTANNDRERQNPAVGQPVFSQNLTPMQTPAIVKTPLQNSVANTPPAPPLSPAMPMSRPIQRQVNPVPAPAPVSAPNPTVAPAPLASPVSSQPNTPAPTSVPQANPVPPQSKPEPVSLFRIKPNRD